MTPPALYIHLPFCSSKCHYCAFSVVTSLADQEVYVLSLLDELASYGPLTPETIYIGGGTPSLLARPLLEKLFAHLPAAKEVSFECNPEQVDTGFLDFLQELGVTRISLGVQTLQESALKAMNRHHTTAHALAAMKALYAKGINWNADLILGLPQVSHIQTLSDLQAVLQHDPAHISAYFLSVEPGTVLASMQHTLSEAVVDTYHALCERLGKAGYEHTELSNWAKPGHTCQHNLHYWHAHDYLGIGLGASSLVQNHTWTNTRNLRLYLERQWLTETPTRLDAEDRLHLQLTSTTRLREGLSWKLLEQITTPANLLYLRRRADTLAAQGFLHAPHQGIILHERAYPVHDAIVRYLSV